MNMAQPCARSSPRAAIMTITNVTVSTSAAQEDSLATLLRRVFCLTFVVAVVEVTTYIDVGGIYPAS